MKISLSTHCVGRWSLLITALVPLVAQGAFNLNIGLNPVAGEGPTGADARYLAFSSPHEEPTTGARQTFSGISFSEGALSELYTVAVSITYTSPDGDEYVDNTKQSFEDRSNLDFNSFSNSWTGLDSRFAVGGEGNPSTFQLNFDGLEADTEYTLTTYHFDAGGGGSSTFTTSVTGATEFSSEASDGINGPLDYAYDFTLISDGSGNASIEFTQIAGSFTRINGLDLVAKIAYDSKNYGYIYWEEGYPTRLFSQKRPQSQANTVARQNPDLVIQTGYYSLKLDCDDLQLTGYDALIGSDYMTALHQDVTQFSPADLNFSVYVDGVRYQCTSGIVQDVNYDNVRLIENGQFVQRFDHMGLIFTDDLGNVLGTTGRLDVTAWPDRVGFQLDFKGVPGVTQTTIELISPSGVVHLEDTFNDHAILMVKPQEDLKISNPIASSWIGVAYDAGTNADLAYHFDEDELALRVDIPAGPVEYPRDTNRVDEYVIDLTNPTSSTQNVPVVFEQPLPRAITGTVMMLCHEDGSPTGLPVQISRNRHGDQIVLHMGDWLRGSSVITLAGNETKRFLLRVIYGYWAGVGTASHAQMSLIGKGGNWKWDVSALGAWGESMTFDPTQHLGSSFLADIRPAFTTPMDPLNDSHDWTEDSGGGDYLIYHDNNDVYRWGKRLKTAYRWTGPNVTEVHYSGITDDEKIRFTYTTTLAGTNDYHRRFFDYKYEFLENVNPNRLVFFQMAAHYTSGPIFDDYYMGNSNGLSTTYLSGSGSNAYIGSQLPFNNQWLAIDDIEKNGTLTNSNRGILSYGSTLNGNSFGSYFHPYGRSLGTEDKLLFDLSSNSVSRSYSAGDVVEGRIGFVMVPETAGDYWGADAEFAGRLNGYTNAWQGVYDEYRYNKELSVTTNAGTLINQYPVEIQAVDADILADFTVNGGGIGHTPVLLTNAPAGTPVSVQRYTGDGTWAWLESVDVEDHNYYQAYRNASGNMDYAFSIKRPTDDLGSDWRVRIVKGTSDPIQGLPPEVTFADPSLDGQVLPVGTSLTVEALPSDADGTIQHVYLYLNGSKLRAEASAPYDWDSSRDPVLGNLSAGSYTLALQATDNDGAVSPTVELTFTVSEQSFEVFSVSGDIGNPLPGSSVEVNGIYTLEGSGSDIWGTSDQFQFTYQTFEGDGVMVARVDSLENTHEWAKAGVMFRASTDANAAFAMVVVTPGKGVSFQWRAFAGDLAQHQTVAGLTAPYWVRLTRTGDIFTGEYSADGINWTAFPNTVTVAMDNFAKVGLALTSHDSTQIATAQFSNVSLSSDVPVVSLFATDADAYESNFPDTVPNNGEITLTRTGILEPLTVHLCIVPLENTGSVGTVCDGTCCSLVGSAGDEEVELEDYELIDEDGQIIQSEVNFALGEAQKIITVRAIADALNEYPETLNIAIEASANGSYNTSNTQNGASIQIFDLPDSPDNVTIFAGTFSRDGSAVTDTNGSGYATATINGPRTEVRFWDEFSGLTSAQQDSHVHKSGVGTTPGSIIYAITETPGDETTDPKLGNLNGYVWDLTQSSGAVPTAGGSASKQVLIDSLFGQNNETPLYLNVHTVDNPAGEIWAFMNVAGGSSGDPGDADPAAVPGSTDYSQLANEYLEADVRRFLNQATFGAMESDVAYLLNQIEQGRQADSNYHRNEAYEDWIDAQMNSEQTYLLDYTLAAGYQFMVLANLFDPVLNPDSGAWTTPQTPARWPQINRDAADPEQWYLDEPYPGTRDGFRLAQENNLDAEPNADQRRHAHWQMMLNADDQLRQKMGFALQQIVVVSEIATEIRRSSLGTANFQDMLNTHAFSHYRDILGFVNWSPLMAKWLSSLQNQKSIDFDGDGNFDVFPDENLARENMQLFSIGLFEVWSDGTLKLNSEGLPQPTYTNDGIREFAKILTGQSFSRYTGYNNGAWGGSIDNTNNNFFASHSGAGILRESYLYPLKMFGEYHATGPKTFAGTTIDNTDVTDLNLQSRADIEDAMDWLAGKPGDGLPDYDMVSSHVSTPAFISRRLIQRFTTSNPSREYLHRVATVFKDSEGHLGQTLKAILLDPEARIVDLNETVFGLKKSPLEGYIQMLRSLEAHTYVPLTNPNGASPYTDAPGDYTNTELYLSTFGYSASQLDNFQKNTRFLLTSTGNSSGRSLQIAPFSQETVFNYYLPDYSPGGTIGAAGLVAPEMQIATETGVMANINYFEDIIRSSVGGVGEQLGGSNENQLAAFGGDPAAGTNDSLRLPQQSLADSLYPTIEPDSALTNLADGSTGNSHGPGVSAPYWVRLSRVGDTFTSSESADGVIWTTVKTHELPMDSEVFAGLALTSHQDGTLVTAEFSNVSVSGGDGTWYSSDIGDVAAAGQTTALTSDSFEIQASGRDIWGNDDEFHFAYQLLDGDVEITARVDSLVATDPAVTLDSYAKAGVMIRETLEADSANVFPLISAKNGIRVQIRRVERGRSSESFADEALVDALDKRLTNGLFKLRYPYNRADNDDPSFYGLDGHLKNPRELIIDAITTAYNNPFDDSLSVEDQAAARLDKLKDAIYLLTFSPEYQIKK